MKGETPSDRSGYSTKNLDKFHKKVMDDIKAGNDPTESKRRYDIIAGIHGEHYISAEAKAYRKKQADAINNALGGKKISKKKADDIDKTNDWLAIFGSSKRIIKGPRRTPPKKNK